MALKYQALNGTVISKTTVIQGMDLTNPGTPHFLQGLTSVEGYYFPFMGFTGRSSSRSALYFGVNNTAQGTNAAPYSKNVKTIEIDGITYRGVTTGDLAFSCLFINPNDTSITTGIINGTLTVIKANSSQGIFVETYALNKTGTLFSDSQAAAIVIGIPKNESDLILSVTFESTE